MHQLQAIKSKPSNEPGARRDTHLLAAPVSEHDRWMELQRGIGNQAVSRMLQRRAAAGPPATGTSAEKQNSGANLILQRKCACGGGAMSSTDECEECSRKKYLGLQTKLRINEPGDVYEQEADRVAEQVLAKPAHSDVGSAQPRIQRYAGLSNGQIGAAPPSVDRALVSPGWPLEPALRRDMEQRFGHDFSRVSVHSGAMAEQSAQHVDASAYTVGHDIVFGAGQFAPGTLEGRRLIAHELTHVVQQGGAAHTVQRAPIVAPAAGATKPTATKLGGPKAISSSFNSYVDLFNGFFQDLAAAAINRGGAGLDSARFGGDLSASHRSLLSRVRTVLIQAQEQDKEQRLAAAGSVAGTSGQAPGGSHRSNSPAVPW